MSERLEATYFSSSVSTVWGWRGILIGDGYLLGDRSVNEGPIHREKRVAEQWMKEVAQLNSDAQLLEVAKKIAWYDDRALHTNYRIGVQLVEVEPGRW